MNRMLMVFVALSLVIRVIFFMNMACAIYCAFTDKYAFAVKSIVLWLALDFLDRVFAAMLEDMKNKLKK